MKPMRPGNRMESWLMATLLFGFIAFLSYYARQREQTVPAQAPTSYSSLPGGVRGWFLLLDRLGYATGRLEAPWTRLSSDTGLLVAVEPFVSYRPLTSHEIAAARRWIAAGGRLYYALGGASVHALPPGPLFSGIEVTQGGPGAEQLSPESVSSPTLANVRSVTVQTPLRISLQPHSPAASLLRDSWGSVLVEKRIGRGALIVCSDAGMSANSRIATADNGILVSNLAAEACGRGNLAVLFDEFHHGAGFTEEVRSGGSPTLWSSAPLPLRLAVIYAFGMALLIVYNRNRRFGSPLVLRHQPPTTRLDYLDGMSALMRRASGPAAAVQSLAGAFVREVAVALDLPPDATGAQMGLRAAERGIPDAGSLGTLIDRLTTSDTWQLSDKRLTELAQQMSAWRDTVGIDG